MKNTEKTLLVRITELLLMHPNILTREERYEVKELLSAMKSVDEDNESN